MRSVLVPDHLDLNNIPKDIQSKASFLSLQLVGTDPDSNSGTVYCKALYWCQVTRKPAGPDHSELVKYTPYVSLFRQEQR